MFLFFFFGVLVNYLVIVLGSLGIGGGWFFLFSGFRVVNGNLGFFNFGLYFVLISRDVFGF